jgi:N-methylhydantoinase A
MTERPGDQIRLGVDIGGTFTDLAAAAGGGLILAKTPTTPGRLADGVIDALSDSGVEPTRVAALVHGTTIAINSITERRGASTALITTRGFRDILEIGRANRPDLYNLSYAKPRPFVPRRLRFEVTERTTYRGEILEQLAEGEVELVAEQLREEDVEAVAVCFLHAWANAEHERRAADVLEERLPHVAIVASHQVSAQWREYERASTVVLSAYVKPVVAGYLGRLEERVRERGVSGRLYAMRSNGGVSSFERALAAPISLLESGPVAGVTAAAGLGRSLGFADVIALDVGGTTAKTSAIRGGNPRIETLHYIERTPTFAGYPVQTPVVEILEIGAGGGSIAWTDKAGGLHVGPRSAGAEPGPACYGRGGTDPTLTDANLVAGRLDPGYFLGGSMPLDPHAAHRALAQLGDVLGVDHRAAAQGVLQYAVAQMAHALRLVTVRRGHDPRDFALVAYGGAGPLHAAFLARELGIRRTIVPPAPGHFSALGMLVGGLRADAVRTHVGRLDPVALTPLFELLEREAMADLEEDAGERTVERFAQLRYVGQEHTLDVPLRSGTIDAPLLEDLRRDFDAASEDIYAFSLPGPVEIVEARVSVSAPGGGVEWGSLAPAGPVSLEPREIDFDLHGGPQKTEVIERSALKEGEQSKGPYVIEEPAATTVVLPGQVLTVDALGDLVIEEAT